MENKTVLSNVDLTMVDLFNEQCRTIGRNGAIQTLQKSIGCVLPESSWKGYDDSNFINALVLEKIIRVRKELVAGLHLSFRIAPISEKVAVALLHKLCEDSNFDMKKLTGISLTDPPNVEYSCYLILIISACLIAKTAVFDEIILNVFNLQLGVSSIAQITSEETGTLQSNALTTSIQPKSDRFNTKGIALSVESTIAIDQALKIFEIGKLAQKKQKFEADAEKIASNITLNPSLQRQARQIGLATTINSAKNRLLAQNRIDSIRAEAPNPNLNVGKDPNNYLALYVLQMSPKVFLLRLLKLKFSNIVFNEYLVKSLKFVDRQIVKAATDKIVTQMKGINIAYDEAAIISYMVNNEKLEIIREHEISRQVPVIVPIKTLVIKNIKEFADALPAIPTLAINSTGDITTEEAIEEETRQKISTLSTRITQQFDAIQRPDHWTTVAQQVPQQIPPLNLRNQQNEEQRANQDGIEEEFDFNAQNN